MIADELTKLLPEDTVVITNKEFIDKIWDEFNLYGSTNHGVFKIEPKTNAKSFMKNGITLHFIDVEDVKEEYFKKSILK